MSRIGEYLRARRELVRPEDVGLPDLGRRRVPGLRREELALLAGISADYYVRLEQGRDDHPSPQVLDALARALRLDRDATAHLHALARPAPPRSETAERVPPGILQLLETWRETPAVVQGRLGDVLAANPLAIALSPIFAPGANTLRAVFLDPAARELYGGEWDEVTESAVAGLRTVTDVDDPELAALVEELSARSERFRSLWARHDVRERTGGGVRTFAHPLVGRIELRYEKLAIAGAAQMLIVYHAEPGSPSAHALARLPAVTA